MADFRVLHRNEISGALTGLDDADAHIFCTPEQISSEIKGCLKILRRVYSVLGFTFQLKLSTRPDNFLGEIEMWNDAEKQLSESLVSFGEPWTLNSGAGAFYGPKIDITITDALKRPHQCATIQLDFQLPIRSNLQYDSVSGEKRRPVIIRQAILGSVEKLIASLTESYVGDWPFWLSPRQSIIIPEEPSCEEYAQELASEIRAAGFICEMDVDQGNTLDERLCNAKRAQYNYMFVVGESDVEYNILNHISHDLSEQEEVSIDEVIKEFKYLKDEFISCLPF